MTTIKCPECNTELSGDVKFCSNCGCQITVKRIVKLYFPIYITGIIISLFGSFLTIDSLLFYFPSYYSDGLYSSDWKEFFIGFAFLIAGIVIAFLGSIISTKKGHWLRTSGFYKIPFYASMGALLFILIFKYEISHPHWFTKNTEITIDGTNWYNIRDRCLQYVPQNNP
jgi:hypothetical protein